MWQQNSHILEVLRVSLLSPSHWMLNSRKALLKQGEFREIFFLSCCLFRCFHFEVQPSLCIHRSCIHRFNQPRMDCSGSLSFEHYGVVTLRLKIDQGVLMLLEFSQSLNVIYVLVSVGELLAGWSPWFKSKVEKSLLSPTGPL